jgi:hypothetical protein
VIPPEELYSTIQYADGSRETGNRGEAVEAPAAAVKMGGENEEVQGDSGSGRPTQKRKARMSESSGSSEDDILKTKLEGLKEGRRRSVLRRLHLRKS